MDTNKILSASLLDIVFDNRNKDYGAYELRRTYARRIKKSLIITGSFFALVITGVAFASGQKNDQKNEVEVIPVELSALKEEIPVPPPEETPPPAEQTPTKTVAFVVPTITDVVDDSPPTQTEIDMSAIGTTDIDGDPDNRPTEVKDPGEGTGITEPPKETDQEPLMIVEVPAKFDGDWKRFLEKNLNPQTPVDNNAPSGRYTVRIKFVVDKEGNVSDIVPLTNIGYGMEDEAVRVLKKAKKWDPAIQNGYKVKAYHVQFITFEVFGDE